MSRYLLETIKCHDGKLYNLEFHQSRFAIARKQLFPDAEPISLSGVINIPESAKSGLFRCRVIYSEIIEKIEFVPHEYRPLKSLKLVEDNSIDYSYKYTDRDRLTQLFEQRADCDDILIVKNGCISDSFTANPVFWDGTQWWTPNTPLLPGTQRARLIAEGKIKVCRVTPVNIINYSKVGLINAMQDLENMPVVEMSDVVMLDT
ncbi:aminotransferase class IV [Maribellus sediminis]|uniref:aminotransferase class IV n=1 Tax=Maribellus sediminis TaxID=2696285 RepID=UPI00142FE67D|nr:aminotransferase class IV [Maribellus sediminis]